MVRNIRRDRDLALAEAMRRETERFLSTALDTLNDPKAEYESLVRALWQWVRTAGRRPVAGGGRTR